MKFMDLTWERAKAFPLRGIMFSGLPWLPKSKTKPVPVPCVMMHSATDNRERHYILTLASSWDDLFGYSSQTYLLVTDFYSMSFEIELLRLNTAIGIVNNLKKMFATFGIPETAVSDNGPQYSNTRNLFSNNYEFKKFTEEWGFSHTTSSPE